MPILLFFLKFNCVEGIILRVSFVVTVHINSITIEAH